MGKGNFYNPDGFQFYIEYQEEVYGDILFDFWLDNVKDIVMSALGDKVYPCNNRENNIHYFAETDNMRIGFADNENNMAICFSPFVTTKYKFSKRSLPEIKKVISALLKEDCEIRCRTSAWTSGIIKNVSEVAGCCDYSQKVY